MNTNRLFLREILVAVAVLAGLALIPQFTSSALITDFVIRLAAFGIFATSLNILIGYGGMVSFGHAMFFGGGAYAFGLLMQKTGMPVPLALLGAVVFCALLGCAVGAICVRLKEIYFAFLTLAFAMLVYSVILSWMSLTGGDQGLVGGIPKPVFLGVDLNESVHFYWFTCFLGVACLLLMRSLMQSPFGYTLRMVRDDPDRARFLGVNVWRTRLYAFVLAGAFAGVAGTIMALFVSGAYPELAYWTMSGEAIFMIMLGGLHIYIGPLVGAALLLMFNDVVTRFTSLHGLALGIIVLVFALGFRRGITDFLMRRFHQARNPDN